MNISKNDIGVQFERRDGYVCRVISIGPRPNSPRNSIMPEVAYLSTGLWVSLTGRHFDLPSETRFDIVARRNQ